MKGIIRIPQSKVASPVIPDKAESRKKAQWIRKSMSILFDFLTQDGIAGGAYATYDWNYSHTAISRSVSSYFRQGRKFQKSAVDTQSMSIF